MFCKLNIDIFHRNQFNCRLQRLSDDGQAINRDLQSLLLSLFHPPFSDAIILISSSIDARPFCIKFFVAT